MLGNSTITRNNDTNAYIMATMNNISAALDSRSMSVGRFILLGVLRCGLVHTPHELRTIIGPNRARTNPEMVLRRGPRTRLGRG